MVTHRRGTSGKHMVSVRRARRTLDIAKQLLSASSAWLSYGAVRQGVYPAIPIPVLVTCQSTVQKTSSRIDGSTDLGEEWMQPLLLVILDDHTLLL